MIHVFQCLKLNKWLDQLEIIIEQCGRYMLAKDEGHGFRKKENRDRMTEAVALFLMENLLKD